MPRLLIFVPCQKVLISKEDNTLTIITVLQEMEVSVPAESPELPDKTTAPLIWYAFCLWGNERDDPETVYHQQFILEAPNGEKVREGPIAEFSMTTPSHRVYSRYPNFPIWLKGTYSLRLQLRRKDAAEWRDIATFPIQIKHTLANPKNTDGGAAFVDSAS